jgi:hypothetical protein
MASSTASRRGVLLAAGACVAWPHLTGAAAADWEQTLGYPTGWGPHRNWTDKAYRVGNYSGGYEQMFRARPIAAPASPSPLAALSAQGQKAFEPVAARATAYLRAWPVSAC